MIPPYGLSFPLLAYASSESCKMAKVGVHGRHSRGAHVAEDESEGSAHEPEEGRILRAVWGAHVC